jgi:hypothetical protein
MAQVRPTQLEFIEHLREISLRSPENQEEMKALENECIELMKQIGDLGFANNCPHEIWHYLTDVDIRYKDPKYAKYQQPHFLAALDEWAQSNAT